MVTFSCDMSTLYNAVFIAYIAAAASGRMDTSKFFEEEVTHDSR